MNRDRPLSPHLQVYKLPLTGLISITHRMTGVMLAIGLIFFDYLIVSVAGGQNEFSQMQDVMDIWLFRLVFWGFVYALFFHLCHGIRHLVWDTGYTFDKATMDQFALYELVVSFVLTLIVFILM